MIPQPDTTTLIKLCSIAVHAEELAEQVTRDPEPGAAVFDATTILTMMSDAEVKGYLASLPSALLPVKR